MYKLQQLNGDYYACRPIKLSTELVQWMQNDTDSTKVMEMALAEMDILNSFKTNIFYIAKRLDMNPNRVDVALDILQANGFIEVYHHRTEWMEIAVDSHHARRM